MEVLQEWSFADYAHVIEGRLRTLLRREEEPKVMPCRSRHGSLHREGVDPRGEHVMIKVDEERSQRAEAL